MAQNSNSLILIAIISVGFLLLAASCTKTEVPAEFQLKAPICGSAKSYKEIPWLDRYITELRKNEVNIGATIHHVKYKDKGYFEVMVPISSRYPYAHFDCDGKTSMFLNTRELQNYLNEQTDKVLVWQFK